MTFSTLRPLFTPLAVVGLLFAAGCSKDSTADANNSLAFNNYDSLVGWVPNVESITREQAHSGKYSVKVGPENEFGLGYASELGKIIDHKPHKIHVAGWGYMTDAKSTARLGFQMFDPAQGKEIFGDGIDFATAVKTPGKWVEISKDITLPDNVTSTNQMRVFLWRASASSPAYIDDLSISEIQ